MRSDPKDWRRKGKEGKRKERGERVRGGEIFLIGVREDLSDYVLSDTPGDGRKWGISLVGPTERILLSLGLPEVTRLPF